MENQTLGNALIVDGNSILNRAFFAIRPLSTKTGIPTNAVWGFLTILLRNIDQYHPAYGAVAFDLPAPTFRHKTYAEYKAARKGMPEELRAQLPWAKKCAEAIGFRVVEKEGYEADDVIGTLAKKAAAEGAHAYVLTGDRDSLQLIDDAVTVLIAANSDTLVFDRARFGEEYGVLPEQFVDVKALMGDSSDNIPGVPGIGEKTALKLIASCGTLEKIYDGLEGLNIAKNARQKLIDGRESAMLSRYLAKIVTDVDLGLDLGDLAIRQAPNDEMIALFNQLEFSSLLKRINLTITKVNTAPETVAPSAVASLPAGEYGVLLAEDKLAVGAADGRVFFCDATWEALRFFANPAHRIVTPDLKKLKKQLDRLGGVPIAGEVFDLGLAAYVLDSNDNSYELPKLTTAYLNEPKNDATEALGAAVRVKNELEKRMNEQEKALYRDLELPLSDVLYEMEKAGFQVDRAGLSAFSEKLGQDADALAEDIYRLAGGEFNLNSPKQLGEVLYEKLGLPAKKKTKTGYSTNAEALESLRMYPIVEELLHWRTLTKLKTTYADGLLSVADDEGRVHTTFNQTVTATGRLSSTEPNLQNIPIRQELGRELRRCFIPKNRDYVLIDADYSQIELRLLAAIADDKLMQSAFLSGDDIHARTASQVFGVPLEAVTPELRKRAKAVNFGIIYGISEYSLAEDIGVSRWQAGEYIKSYLDKYAGVREYMRRVVEDARRDGYVTTLMGRRRYIPELTSGKAALRAFGERVAMNSPIQGTAADVIKKAMLGTARSLEEAKIDAKMILQVHDELILESHRDCAEEASAILRREMEHAIELSVPLTVELTVGDSWYN